MSKVEYLLWQTVFLFQAASQLEYWGIKTDDIEAQGAYLLERLERKGVPADVVMFDLAHLCEYDDGDTTGKIAEEREQLIAEEIRKLSKLAA